MATQKKRFKLTIVLQGNREPKFKSFLASNSELSDLVTSLTSLTRKIATILATSPFTAALAEVLVSEPDPSKSTRYTLAWCDNEGHPNEMASDEELTTAVSFMNEIEGYTNGDLTTYQLRLEQLEEDGKGPEMDNLKEEVEILEPLMNTLPANEVTPNLGSSLQNPGKEGDPEKDDEKDNTDDQGGAHDDHGSENGDDLDDTDQVDELDDEEADTQESELQPQASTPGRLSEKKTRNPSGGMDNGGNTDNVRRSNSGGESTDSILQPGHEHLPSEDEGGPKLKVTSGLKVKSSGYQRNFGDQRPEQMTSTGMKDNDGDDDSEEEEDSTDEGSTDGDSTTEEEVDDDDDGGEEVSINEGGSEEELAEMLEEVNRHAGNDGDEGEGPGPSGSNQRDSLRDQRTCICSDSEKEKEGKLDQVPSIPMPKGMTLHNLARLIERGRRKAKDVARGRNPEDRKKMATGQGVRLIEIEKLKAWQPRGPKNRCVKVKAGQPCVERRGREEKAVLTVVRCSRCYGYEIPTATLFKAMTRARRRYRQIVRNLPKHGAPNRTKKPARTADTFKCCNKKKKLRLNQLMYAGCVQEQGKGYCSKGPFLARGERPPILPGMKLGTYPSEQKRTLREVRGISGEVNRLVKRAFPAMYDEHAKHKGSCRIQGLSRSGSSAGTKREPEQGLCFSGASILGDIATHEHLDTQNQKGTVSVMAVLSSGDTSLRQQHFVSGYREVGGETTEGCQEILFRLEKGDVHIEDASRLYHGSTAAADKGKEIERLVTVLYLSKALNEKDHGSHLFSVSKEYVPRYRCSICPYSLGPKQGIRSLQDHDARHHTGHRTRKGSTSPGSQLKRTCGEEDCKWGTNQTGDKELRELEGYHLKHVHQLRACQGCGEKKEAKRKTPYLNYKCGSCAAVRCSFCNRTYTLRKSLNQHLRVAHGGKANTKDSNTEAQEENRKGEEEAKGDNAEAEVVLVQPNPPCKVPCKVPPTPRPSPNPDGITPGSERRQAAELKATEGAPVKNQGSAGSSVGSSTGSSKAGRPVATGEAMYPPNMSGDETKGDETKRKDKVGSKEAAGEGNRAHKAGINRKTAPLSTPSSVISPASSVPTSPTPQLILPASQLPAPPSRPGAPSRPPAPQLQSVPSKEETARGRKQFSRIRWDKKEPDSSTAGPEGNLTLWRKATDFGENLRHRPSLQDSDRRGHPRERHSGGDLRGLLERQRESLKRRRSMEQRKAEAPSWGAEEPSRKKRRSGKW